MIERFEKNRSKILLLVLADDLASMARFYQHVDILYYKADKPQAFVDIQGLSADESLHLKLGAVAGRAQRHTIDGLEPYWDRRMF